MQTTDGLAVVLSDAELRARVYSEPLLPNTDKTVPQPDKAVWKHLTVGAMFVARTLPGYLLTVATDSRCCALASMTVHMTEDCSCSAELLAAHRRTEDALFGAYAHVQPAASRAEATAG